MLELKLQLIEVRAYQRASPHMDFSITVARLLEQIELLEAALTQKMEEKGGHS